MTMIIKQQLFSWPYIIQKIPRRETFHWWSDHILRFLQNTSERLNLSVPAPARVDDKFPRWVILKKGKKGDYYLVFFCAQHVKWTVTLLPLGFPKNVFIYHLSTTRSLFWSDSRVERKLNCLKNMTFITGALLAWYLSFLFTNSAKYQLLREEMFFVCNAK